MRRVTPTRVLSCQADDQLPKLHRGRRSAGALPPPPARPASDELTVPSQHGLGSHYEGAPAIAREQAAQSSKQHFVLGAETRLARLTRNDLELMAQHQDLDVFGIDSSAC